MHVTQPMSEPHNHTPAEHAVVIEPLPQVDQIVPHAVQPRASQHAQTAAATVDKQWVSFDDVNVSAPLRHNGVLSMLKQYRTT